MPSVFPQWAQDINTGLGVFGFLITVYVMIEVRSIKRSFLSRARLPELVRDLEKAGSALNASLDGWPLRRNDARSQIKIAASLLHSATSILPKEERRIASAANEKLRAAAERFDRPEFEQADPVWDLYSDVQSTITSLKQVSKNLKWE